MEHGFGGMFMIRVLLVFLFIYVVFIGIALNIAKAYRIKNGVINIIEHNQVHDVKNDPIFEEDGALADYLNGIPYVVSAQNQVQVRTFCDDKSSSFGYDNNSDRGVCIIKVNGDDNKSFYYKIYVFMSVDFNFFGVNTLIPIGGETITMTND